MKVKNPEKILEKIIKEGKKTGNHSPYTHTLETKYGEFNTAINRNGKAETVELHLKDCKCTSVSPHIVIRLKDGEVAFQMIRVVVTEEMLDEAINVFNNVAKIAKELFGLDATSKYLKEKT